MFINKYMWIMRWCLMVVVTLFVVALNVLTMRQVFSTEDGLTSALWILCTGLIDWYLLYKFLFSFLPAWSEYCWYVWQQKRSSEVVTSELPKESKLRKFFNALSMRLGRLWWKYGNILALILICFAVGFGFLVWDNNWCSHCFFNAACIWLSVVVFGGVMICLFLRTDKWAEKYLD